jgi:tRNA G18 (ribose-2'-O)-methylase SpoU
MQNNIKLNPSQLQRHDVESYRKIDKIPVILILDNIRSALNVGSIFRSADAFNVAKIYLSGITATPPNKDILKAALGATESVEWEQVGNILQFIQELKEHNQYDIVAVEQTTHSLKLHRFIPAPGRKYAFVLGNEVDGVNQDIVALSHFCVEIPQFGTKHSLNVAVAAGIVLWDFIAKSC